MKGYKRLLGVSSIVFLSLGSGGCFKGAMENLLTYNEECIKDETAKKNMQEEGWRYVKEERYTDAEIAFLSINDLPSLEKLAAVLLKDNMPEGARDIYLLLEKNNYEIRPKEDVLKELKEDGYVH